MPDPITPAPNADDPADAAPTAARPPPAGSRSDPAAVVLAADLLKWVIPAVGKFPRNVRYGLGGRFESALTDVLEALVVAQYCRGAQRTEALQHANLRLQAARHLLRLCYEMKLLREHQYVHCAGLMHDLGNQVGAWRRASASTANSTRD